MQNNRYIFFFLSFFRFLGLYTQKKILSISPFFPSLVHSNTEEWKKPLHLHTNTWLQWPLPVSNNL